MNSISPRAAAGNRFLVRPGNLDNPHVPLYHPGGGQSAEHFASRVFYRNTPTATPLGRLGRLGASTGPSTATKTAAAAGILMGAVQMIKAPGGDQKLAAAGATLMSMAPLTGPAAPFVLAGGAIATFLGNMGVGGGCGESCVLTSSWANEAEGHLKTNIQAYFAVPSPRPASVQQMALTNFDAIWNWMAEQCSNPKLGGAGRNCISDRQAGACKWKADSNSPYPGGPAQGACWNWYNGYRDPIANDPAVPDDQLDTAGGGGGLFDDIFGGGGGGGDLVPKSSSLILLAGLALMVFAMMGDN